MKQTIKRLLEYYTDLHRSRRLHTQSCAFPDVSSVVVFLKTIPVNLCYIYMFLNIPLEKQIILR